jgi:peptidoglycan/xylan/chitin deacetylase (PgdA/CDA1 family)
MTPVPILTYHALNMSGHDYAGNDHVALAEDLRFLHGNGYRIVRLVDVVDARVAGRQLPDKPVAITLDDGSDFDFHDIEHQHLGMQRSMLNVLRDFRGEVGAAGQPTLEATSFVIASPRARSDLDQVSLIGRGWMSEAWWGEAARSRLMPIANHSWDHHHTCVREAVERGGSGTFHSLRDRAGADLQVRRARDYIAERAPGRAVALFAYPYGDASEYLIREYFPLGEAVTGTIAAFSADPAHVTAGSSVWDLPRYVCGANWKSTADLAHLLAQG